MGRMTRGYLRGVPAKKARTDATDTVPSSGSSGVFWVRVERAEDVMELRRLGPDLFEADIRTGVRLIGDAQLLGTPLQFQAKLAILQVRDFMSAQKAKATQEQNSAGETSAGGKSTEPPSKKPRMLQEHFEEKTLALQSTLIAWRSWQPCRGRSRTAIRVVQLPLRKTVVGSSITARATTTF